MSDDESPGSSHGLLPTGSGNPSSSAEDANSKGAGGLGSSFSVGNLRRFRSAAAADGTAASGYGQIESHQFDPDESEVWKHHQLERHFEDQGQWWTFAKYREVRRWFLTLYTSLWIAVIAFFITFMTKLITSLKFDTFNSLIEQEKAHRIPYGCGFLFLIAYNIACALTAYAFVYIEPLAAGSGIPEMKAFLNGVNIPRLVDVKTLICKAIGIIFSCSAGLPLGKEGPMIHIGSVVAAGVSQGKSAAMGMETAFSKVQDFRNDKEKRDFVACGAGAGVAAAFGAPIGGVLFSFEEGASFWTTKLTWRCFFCCMATVSALYTINSLPNMFGHSDNGAMFSFGEFFSLEGEKSNYSMWEFSMFLLVGVLGGMIGACFVSFNDYLFHFRNNWLNKRISKMTEVIIVTTIMSLISIILPMLWTKCTPLPVDMKGWSAQEKSLVTELNPLYCPSQTHYNELASLYLTDSDGAIKQLFHFREIGDHKVSTFSSGALFLFAIPYISMACVSSGIAVPAGMFVPSLLSGAAFGRLVGHILHKVDQTRGTFADSGTYALMGAAAVTGGITRITVSLTLMILEATGDMQYVLPLMLTIMAAFVVGNIFTKSLYDQYIHNRHLHHLEEEESISNMTEFHDLTICDIMTKWPICVKPVVRVGEIYDTLQEMKHHCFPVVIDNSNISSTIHNNKDIDDTNTLYGTITRKVICTLLKHRAFAPPSSDPNSVERISPLVNWGTLERVYPNYPKVEDLEITARDRQCWLDLRPYIDFSSFTINENASVQRAYRMFRTLGLRHLCVVTHTNKIVGIATRVDMAKLESMHEDKDNEMSSVDNSGDDGSIEIELGSRNSTTDSGVNRRRKARPTQTDTSLSHTVNINLN